MRKINVEDKSQIKRLLYTGSVFGLRGDEFRAFGGFQLWWYDKQFDVCSRCESHWADIRRKVQQCSLDKATSVLWRNRKSLFLRHRRLREDRKLMIVNTSQTRGNEKVRTAACCAK